MKRTLSVLILSAAFTAAPAFAQVSHVYAGAGVGIANTDSSEFSWKILAGYQHDRHWGIEAAYTDLGRYRGSNADSLSLAFTGTLPLDRRWALIAKAGVASNRTRVAGASDHADRPGAAPVVERERPDVALARFSARVAVIEAQHAARADRLAHRLQLPHGAAVDVEPRRIQARLLHRNAPVGGQRRDDLLDRGARRVGEHRPAPGFHHARAHPERLDFVQREHERGNVEARA